MYLGKKSVTNLEQFVNGIYLGIYYSLESLGYKEMYPGNYLWGFDQCLRHRYKVKDMRSMGSILLDQAGEEEKAFELWFLEFCRYLTENERLHSRFLARITEGG